MLTPAQRNRVIGFGAALKVRGVELQHPQSGNTFRAIIEPASSLKLRKTEVVINQLVTDILHASRDAIAAIESDTAKTLDAGTVFTRADSEYQYRVHERHDDSANVVAIVFHCQAFTPDPT